MTTNPPTKTVSFRTADRELARALAAALQDLVYPPPDALTIFEQSPAPVSGAPRKNSPEKHAPGSSETTVGETAPHWSIDAYYAQAPDPDALHGELVEILARPVPRPDVVEVPDENWVAISQQALPPVFAGGFVVHGSHDNPTIGRRWRAIEVDAGEAFGTAHHATTYGCLIALSELLANDRQRLRRATLLDLGTGSGVLAIAAARVLPFASIIATDIDAEACRVARQNARTNRVATRLGVRRTDGVDEAGLRARAPFDIVIANILAGPLIEMSRDIAGVIAPAGRLILSGILVPQARSVIAAYRAAGFRLDHHRRIAGWSSLTLTRLR